MNKNILFLLVLLMGFETTGYAEEVEPVPAVKEYTEAQMQLAIDLVRLQMLHSEDYRPIECRITTTGSEAYDTRCVKHMREFRAKQIMERNK